jgi:hypothetical protein
MRSRREHETHHSSATAVAAVLKRLMDIAASYGRVGNPRSVRHLGACMKTTIRADGTLVIAPETEFEAYALNCWGKENITSDWFDATRPQLKIIIDLSEYSHLLDVAVRMPGAGAASA